MYKVVRTSRLYEQIVQQIEDSITKGTLKAGDQLPSERELALKFGVSRTAVREAVKASRMRRAWWKRIRGVAHSLPTEHRRRFGNPLT